MQAICNYDESSHLILYGIIIITIVITIAPIGSLSPALSVCLSLSVCLFGHTANGVGDFNGTDRKRNWQMYIHLRVSIELSHDVRLLSVLSVVSLYLCFCLSVPSPFCLFLSVCLCLYLSPTPRLPEPRKRRTMVDYCEQ